MTRCTTARRAEARGYRYEARLRGLEMYSIYLTTTKLQEHTLSDSRTLP